jgi:steroid delta-isomerase-like uncharacterized protein
MGAVEVARESIEAFNAGDWDRFRSLHAEDVVEDELGTQRRIEGSDALVESNQGWKQAFPDASGLVTNAVESGDTATLEITWSGTHSGPLEMPDGELPATNKRVELRACQVFRVEGDRIAEDRNYFDMATMLQQLGAMEQAATT